MVGHGQEPRVSEVPNGRAYRYRYRSRYRHRYRNRDRYRCISILLSPSLSRRIGARSVHASADRPSLAQAPQAVRATSDHSYLLATPKTQVASRVAGPCGVVASIDLSTQSRVQQLCWRPAG